MHWVPKMQQHELPWKTVERIYCKLKITQLCNLYRVLDIGKCLIWSKFCNFGKCMGRKLVMIYYASPPIISH